jgi:hypothetical protein
MWFSTKYLLPHNPTCKFKGLKEIYSLYSTEAAFKTGKLAKLYCRRNYSSSNFYGYTNQLVKILQITLWAQMLSLFLRYFFRYPTVCV